MKSNATINQKQRDYIRKRVREVAEQHERAIRNETVDFPEFDPVKATRKRSFSVRELWQNYRKIHTHLHPNLLYDRVSMAELFGIDDQYRKHRAELKKREDTHRKKKKLRISLLNKRTREIIDQIMLGNDQEAATRLFRAFEKEKF